MAGGALLQAPGLAQPARAAAQASTSGRPACGAQPAPRSRSAPAAAVRRRQRATRGPGGAPGAGAAWGAHPARPAGRLAASLVADPDTGSLELTEENVELVLDEVRPYLMAGAASGGALLCRSPRWADALRRADGGNVSLVDIDGPTVYLKLQGACGSCPSSLTTMTMGIRRKLQESIPVRAPSPGSPGATAAGRGR